MSMPADSRPCTNASTRGGESIVVLEQMIESREIGRVGRGGVIPYLPEAPGVEVVSILVQMHEHEIVVAGPGLDDRFLRAVD